MYTTYYYYNISYIYCKTRLHDKYRILKKSKRAPRLLSESVRIPMGEVPPLEVNRAIQKYVEE